jgi:hypothetical protein
VVEYLREVGMNQSVSGGERSPSILVNIAQHMFYGFGVA